MPAVSDEPPILASLRTAVEAAPHDVALRLHFAEILLDWGRSDEAVRHLGAVLEKDPSSAAARALMVKAVAAPTAPAEPAPGHAEAPAANENFDWTLAESQVGDLVPPMFVEGEDEPEGDAYEVEASGVTLADVAGMDDVKKRLNAAFLAPMRNPKLRTLYGKKLRGGLLMYGPPGCGKTFLARAVAGELGAHFLAVSVADVIDMFIGQSERNIREVFQLARRHAPCVLFLDEIDALGQKRSQLRNSAMRSSVNQLLHEMDGLSANNEGVFILGATNHPWDVDSALRRPGRFDRTLLVLPPDEDARQEVFRFHLRDRPIEGVNLRKLARMTDGYSGADIAHISDTAAETALLDSVNLDEPRFISMHDLESAVSEVRPSIGPWLETARNVAMFANEGGIYDELVDYLKRQRLM